MELEWDIKKSVLNLEKHGVTFEDAALIFHDNQRLEVYGNRSDYGEDRWVTIGYVDPALLFVVYTIRYENTIRLISARRANEQERQKYRQANS
ncbi:BrnT family toxin [Klebsiella sp. BIGb0407]|uniref:BrnT family toxin n=1 Tax=Klebsiella sp. BIGb0407 TaxID=2940603 RepID=UPI00216A6230|nr:BrnT family toxin [Klebsiella sp. BIGb0407]MCS3433054.1 uncharacterized DUF497 family protein [Klebsiella sp. BIGb0407]